MWKLIFMMNKTLNDLILKIRLNQYKINNNNNKKYVQFYKKERIKLENELTKILSNLESEVSEIEQIKVMAKIKPYIIESVKNIGTWETNEIYNRLFDVYGESYFETNKLIQSGIITTPSISFDLVRPEVKGNSNRNKR